ncbi:MAG: hypothetical protein WAS73_17265 [Defluviicoccus sp.]
MKGYLHPGQRVGRWILLSRTHQAPSSGKRWRPRWHCRCDCGTEKMVLDQSLRLALRSDAGGSRSCGCLVIEASLRHGQNRHQKPSSEYMAWIGAKKRCRNMRNASYRNYGGRGIRMCARWEHSFEAFLCDMGPKPDPTYSLDRIDPDGNYEPGNCRWAPPTIQQRNKRNTRWYEFDERACVLIDIARSLGISRDAARAMERRGMLPARRLAGVLDPQRPFQPTFFDLNLVAPLTDLTGISTET